MDMPGGRIVDRPVGRVCVAEGRIVTGVVLVTSCPTAPGVAVDGMVADGRMRWK